MEVERSRLRSARRAPAVIASIHKNAYSDAVSPLAAATVGLAGSPRWELYRLLADATRVRLLALASLEELGVSELAELLREGQPKVSRHAALLRDAELLRARRHGTWLLLRTVEDWQSDPVVADAVHAGLAACRADGTLERVAEVVAARDAATRAFFARGGRPVRSGAPEELTSDLAALGELVWPRGLAIDVGCGDGALLEVVAPVFGRVIALDRSEAQLEAARARAERRGLRNVRFVRGEVDGPEIRRALGGEQAGRNGARHAAGRS
ncbi:MAG: methyltransferase domain-containing protein, partial [Myxococcales bacterium]|nr:methyltransferase domain-containing protein [Myxococcales bacterium]